ncbi:LysR substrate-binding domain-containing protein [Pseudomonas sp. NPDC007930]|uniref:LysR family transcriptional regulator n=1 Tax=Pseudomonas sp. NPDC007930 TaxID=3364417 RepID=UPI0036E9D3AD
MHQLRCFVAVAEELHFGRAAARLFMTQPPLSRQIQLLERDLGITLLERNNRAVRLTAAGAGFLADARRILTYTEQAGDHARRLARGEAGRLVLGFTAVAGYRMVPQLLRQVAEALPQLQVKLMEMVSDAQLEALLAGLLDVAFLRHLPPQANVASQQVWREPMLAVLPEGHRLAALAEVPCQALDQQPFIMYSSEEARYFYDAIAGLFAMTGATPQYRYHLAQTHTILNLVRAGFGVAIVPASAQQLGAGLVFRPLAEGLVHAETYMAWRTDNANPGLAAFRGVVQGAKALQ